MFQVDRRFTLFRKAVFRRVTCPSEMFEDNGKDSRMGKLMQTVRIPFAVFLGSVGDACRGARPVRLHDLWRRDCHRGYTGPAGPVIIPATINGMPVTSIGTEAFRANTNLTSVTIDNNVTAIGENAFERCTSLTSATIGSSVTSIAPGAFTQCTSLTNVTIGRV